MAPTPPFSRPLPVDVAHAEPLTTEFVDIGNGWESLVKLFDLPRGGPTRVIDGELQFADAAARYRLQRPGASAPPAAATGIKVGIDGSRFFSPDSPGRLDAFWLKEAVADGGAKVAFAGWVV